MKRVNAYYAALPVKTRDQPVHVFGSRPPPDQSFLVTRLWDRYRPKWRELPKLDLADPQIQARLQELVNRNFVARKGVPVAGVAAGEVEALSQQRIVRRRKGSWVQLPPEASS